MSKSENKPPKRKWGCREWFLALLAVCTVIGGVLAYVVYQIMIEAASQTNCINSCRQITMAMHIYANDHLGKFPDTVDPSLTSANQVLRRLIQDEIIQDERVFGAKYSPFIPDGELGTDYVQSVQPGENHWMITGGLNEGSPQHYPFIFENALSALWPLVWAPRSKRELRRGRTWSANGILIGRLDSSVTVEHLIQTKEGLTLPDSVLKPEGEAPFPPLHVLDIEERKP